MSLENRFHLGSAEEGFQNKKMPRTQRNDNFIDKTFTVIADILLKVLPTSQREKQRIISALLSKRDA